MNAIIKQLTAGITTNYSPCSQQYYERQDIYSANTCFLKPDKILQVSFHGNYNMIADCHTIGPSIQGEVFGTIS